MVGPMRPQFVLFGSSIVEFSCCNEGWGAILADIYARKADILLRGYAGWTSRHALGVLDQVFPLDAALQPSLVIVYFGGNDSILPHPSGFGSHVPLPEYIENMRKIATHLKNLSEKTRIIFLSAPPVNKEKIREIYSDTLAELRTIESCRIYSEACLALCREINVKGIDLWTALQKKDGWATDCLTDGIHLSAEGSKIVVEEIMNVLREADWEPSLHWKSMPTEFEQVFSVPQLSADFNTAISIFGDKPAAGDIQMKVYSVPCLEDNYSYLIVDESSKEAAAVDPVEAEKVVEAAKQHGVLLKLVLTTHHHWDHAGGNDKIKQLVPGIKVYGGSHDNVKGCTDQVENGDKLVLGAHINILCLHTPCHTKGHISYYLTSKEEEELAVFTGDTLFIAGCGKFFEGTAEQMYQSLCVTLGSLPKPTRVYCGHEYTVKNLQFALTVEPDNVKIQQKITWALHQRQAGLPTIPSTIEEEIETNPFMRVDQPEIQARVGCRSPVEALQEIRRRKDNWRG